MTVGEGSLARERVAVGEATTRGESSELLITAAVAMPPAASSTIVPTISPRRDLFRRAPHSLQKIGDRWLRSSVPHSGQCNFVARGRIELPTPAFSVPCSTN